MLTSLPPVNNVLITADEIQEKVKWFGAQITHDFAGSEVHLISILRGGLVLLADLIRRIELPLTYDTIEISSYGDSKESSGIVRLVKDLTSNIENRNVILVEDIIDTGISLNYLVKNLQTRKPKSVKVCVLLDKYEARKVQVQVDYCGFKIPNSFIVGYGLDYQGYYRNLPYIGILD
ncbi:MAG: hypoxanthine phosphoribosyltransferase [Candidatus Delongbacteria bacterium]|nr:hypoxanthine phosphoribosyltransferase [Candidatus Delongbacteria bacterium]